MTSKRVCTLLFCLTVTLLLPQFASSSKAFTRTCPADELSITCKTKDCDDGLISLYQSNPPCYVTCSDLGCVNTTFTLHNQCQNATIECSKACERATFQLFGNARLFEENPVQCSRLACDYTVCFSSLNLPCFLSLSLSLTACACVLCFVFVCVVIYVYIRHSIYMTRASSNWLWLTRSRESQCTCTMLPRLKCQLKRML